MGCMLSTSSLTRIIVSGASFTLSNSSFAIPTIRAEIVMRPAIDAATDSGSPISALVECRYVHDFLGIQGDPLYGCNGLQR
ncbi:hypothetical protein BGX38DRAFT_1169388 [Terfezia claveryi]|nr:hypothetical protein BGX38DRAFT_1169388 [Terfezia claveryi]